MQKTSIPWTDYTWNPLCGCPRPLASAGCDNCYARQLHTQRHTAYLAGKKLPAQYAQGFDTIQMFADRLEEPLRVRTPSRIFVGSMTDLFHEAVPDAFIDQVYRIFDRCPHHTFQLLTKRPKRRLQYHERFGIGTEPKNVWQGATFCTQKELFDNMQYLRELPAAVRFVSLEPLLEEMDLRLWSSPNRTYILEATTEFPGFRHTGTYDSVIGWVIVGCESGPRRRVCPLEWVESIVAQCRSAGVPVFVKQIGGIGPGVTQDMARWPEHMRVREWPD
jgi:protein gp37